MHVVGAILGHRTPQMTKRHAHLSSDYLKGEMEKMTKRIFSTHKQTPADPTLVPFESKKSRGAG